MEAVLNTLLSRRHLWVHFSMAVFASIGCSRGPAAAKDVRVASLDELIEQLPQDHEWVFDEKTKKYVYHPAVHELRTRLERGVKPTDDQWRHALLRSRAIRSRECWPVGASVALSMRTPTWLGPVRVQVTPKCKELKPACVSTSFGAGCGLSSPMKQSPEKYTPIGKLALGSHRINYDVSIHRISPRHRLEILANSEPELIWAGPLQMPATIVPSLDDAIPPIFSSFHDIAVRSSVGLAFIERQIHGEKCKAPVLVFEFDALARSILGSTALSLQIELRRSGILVEWMNHLIGCPVQDAPGRVDSRGARSPQVTAPWLLLPKEFEAGPIGSEWSLLIRGTDRNILKVFDAKTWWKGETHISLRHARETEIARVGPNGRVRGTLIPSER